MDTDRLIVVGAGYVGLVAGTCFSSAGYTVGIVEKNKSKLETLQKGECPFYEPSLSELMKEGIKNKRLKFYADQQSAMQDIHPEFIFCAVGTPENPDGSANLQYVEDALSESLSIKSANPIYFVLKSTVPVGTGKRLQKLADSKNPGKFWIVNNPEFLREGTAVSDFLRPERVVLGGDPTAVSAVSKLYQSFLLNSHPLIKTDSTTAELGKLAANLLLASGVSLVNQVARLSAATNSDIRHIEKILQSDSRIGSKYLYAGLGFGGSCFPKDIKNFINICNKLNVNSSVAEAIDSFNDEQKLFFTSFIEKDFPNAQDTCVTLLGLAFKPETDDIRESPALSIAEALNSKGYKLKVYDPKALENFKNWATGKKLSNITYCDNQTEALKNSQAIVLVTEWQEFQRLTPQNLKGLFEGTHIYDGKNVLDAADFKAAHYKYLGVGLS